MFLNQTLTTWKTFQFFFINTNKEDCWQFFSENKLIKLPAPSWAMQHAFIKLKLQYIIADIILKLKTL